MPNEPDAELLARFVHADRDAFEALFRQFEPEVYRWIMRIVRDRGRAEDVAIETFWRAYRARARFDWSRSFGAWIRRIATNAALDHLRAERRHGGVVPVYERMMPSPPLDTGVHDALAAAFSRLPVKLRAVATLALIEELPHAEIAEALAIPVGTVKSRLHRALRSLRDELRTLGIDS
jgi:RNA polymerase sigma-70 factor (ECF subfamily)